MDSLTSRRPTAILVVLVVLGTLLLAALAGSHRGLPLLAVIGLLGLILLAVLLRQPGLALPMMAALSFTLPLQIGTGSDVTLTAPVVLIPIVVIAWLADALRTGGLRLPASPATLPICLFVVSGALSLIAGNAYWDPLVPRPANLLLVQLAQWAIFMLSAALFLATAELGQHEKSLQRATFAFLCVGGVAVVLGYIYTAPARALGWPIARMANSGMFWTWLGAMATGQLVHNRHLRTWARLALLVVLAAATYVVWIRQPDWVSGWFPFTVSVLLVIWLRLWRRNRMVGITTAVILIVMAFFLYPLVFHYVGGEQQLVLSWGGRRVLYAAVLDLAKAHPILGLGPASYRHYAFTRWLSMGTGRALYLRPLVSSHNNYIDVYAQMGLVGLIFFFWFLISVAKSGWRSMSRFRDDFAEGYVVGAVGGLAGTLVAMMLVDWLLPFVYNVGFSGLRTSALAWMFLGGLVALEQQGRAAGGKEMPGWSPAIPGGGATAPATGSAQQ